MEKKRGHVRTASNWSTASVVRKRTTSYNEKKDYHTSIQKFARECQKGVTGSLQRFFLWYGELVATHPWKAIIACLAITIAGGSGLLRFYEEGDAASLVIPRDSEFRKNIDWQDENFPREIRVHSVIYTAENVLTPEVFQSIYQQRKNLDRIQLEGNNKTFQDFCIQVPIPKLPEGGIMACSATGDGKTTENPKWKEMEDWGAGWDMDSWDDDEMGSWGDDSWENDTEWADAGGIERLLPLFMPKAEDINIDTLVKWSDEYYPDLYCGCMEAAETACFEQNIVELWGDQGHYNENSDLKMAALTEEEILDTINNNNVSGIFLKDFNFKELLGDVKYDAYGRIVGAGSVRMQFLTTVNVTAVKLFGTATRGEKIDLESYTFEGEMIKMLMNREFFPSGLISYVNIQRQFFDSFVGQTFKDADKLVLGYMLVFVYVNVMLSKMSCVEQRIGLSIVGILSVTMGMILGYGICSMFGLFYSAAHTVIPFLLLGIGIDNIFVITQTFNTMESSSNPLELTKRFGQTMSHAGVAVSVTTFTDVIAFLVGSYTVLPCLQSFCIYAAVSIFAIYALQVTHFVAWFALDTRRQAEHRDGCICCYVHKKFEPFEFSQKSVLNSVFRFIGEQIVKRWFQMCILALSAGFLTGGIWGTLFLTQEYNPEWLLPPESEIAKWFSAMTDFYPSSGEPGFVMVKYIDIPQEFFTLDTMIKRLEATKEHNNIEKIKSWHFEFRDYVNKFKPIDASFEILIRNESFFREKFTQFLFSPKGASYQPNFEFSSPLKCGQPAPDVLLQAIEFQHNRYYRSSEWIPAMREVQQIVRETPFSNDSYPLALTYINWETDAIVGIELIRNVSMALACIFVTTLITLGSWRGSMFVMMCVLFSCLNVCGFMHWWGLTIDITSMNVIIISVGICVDFCAHIVHGFLTEHGSREKRVLHIMEHVAPAVMNGGFSTMLALSLLVTSQSHIFISFFKIFFMICIFGLFHGLILLPVVLCLLGPIENEDEKEARKNAVALANAKESHQYQPALHQQVKKVDQQLKSVDQQLKLSDQPMKSEMQLKTLNELSPVEQPDGDVLEKLKLTEKQEPDKQLKSVEQLNSAEQQEPVELKSVDDELKPAETAAQMSIEKEARNGDVKIHVKQNAPPDKMEVKEEVMKINIEAGDDDEEAMEALLSRDMRETEIR